MLNSELNLSDNIFSPNLGKAALRDGFGEALVILGKTNPSVVVLSADVKESARCHWFEKKFPKRFFEMGVAEQNMAGVAAGLGVSGKIPYIATYAAFSPGRNWEQIRTTIAYNDSNVKIAGHHAGIATGPDGATHQAIEDIAIMRAMPNMKVIVPCDAIEARKATIAASQIWGPVYFRLTREKTPVMTTEYTPFVPQKAYTMFSSANISGRAKKPIIGIIGAGPILYNALIAAKELEKQKIGIIVLNMHTIKPIDEKAIIDLAKKCKAIVTVEDHNIIGGLGSAVAEVLSKNHPLPMEFIGVKDVFGESGSSSQLSEKYGLDTKAIKNATLKILKKV